VKRRARASLSRALTQHAVAHHARRSGLATVGVLERHHARRELRAAWDAHVTAQHTRHTHLLAGRSGHPGLHRLDPLAALGLERPAGELEAGS